MKRILCWLGIHDWRYAEPPIYEGEVYFKFCSRCDKIIELFVMFALVFIAIIVKTIRLE